MHGFIIKLHGINWKKTCGESENHTQEEWDFFFNIREQRTN